MPMKTRRRKAERCYTGICRRPIRPDQYFDIDLHDGKPHIRIYACSKEHLESLRIGHARFEVKGGG